MNKLDNARIKINEIDQKMAELFEERMIAVEDVVSYKLENDMPVLDSSREKVLLEKNLKYIKDEKYIESYTQYFEYMMNVSRTYQQKIIDEHNK